MLQQVHPKLNYLLQLGFLYPKKAWQIQEPCLDYDSACIMQRAIWEAFSCSISCISLRQLHLQLLRFCPIKWLWVVSLPGCLRLAIGWLMTFLPSCEGFGNHLARPLFRERHNAEMSEEDAVTLIKDALRVISTFYLQHYFAWPIKRLDQEQLFQDIYKLGSICCSASLILWSAASGHTAYCFTSTNEWIQEEIQSISGNILTWKSLKTVFLL